MQDEMHIAGLCAICKETVKWFMLCACRTKCTLWACVPFVRRLSSGSCCVRAGEANAMTDDADEHTSSPALPADAAFTPPHGGRMQSSRLQQVRISVH